jgi:superoxide dismutase, Fe-Mn family
MPWDEIEPRKFPAFDKDLDGISKQTMEDHYKLYEGYVKKTNECRKLLNEIKYSEIEGNEHRRIERSALVALGPAELAERIDWPG